jgi:hypothetical protein
VVVAALRGRPYVELTPRAVVLRGAFGRCTVPWEALQSGPPYLGARTLPLAVARPDLVVSRGLARGPARVTLANAGISRWLLAGAIRYYVDHPDRRAAIGTPAEHDRLLAELSAAQ